MRTALCMMRTGGMAVSQGRREARRAEMKETGGENDAKEGIGRRNMQRTRLGRGHFVIHTADCGAEDTGLTRLCRKE